MSTVPWLDQLTRNFNRINKLTPTALDVSLLVGATRYNPINPDLDTAKSRATFIYSGDKGNYRGSELVTFETVNLEMLFKNNTVPTVFGYNPKNTLEVAELFVAQYGLSLAPEWFENTPFDATELPMHVTLRTISTPYCSKSKLTVKVERSESDISELFKNDVIDAPTLPFDPVFHSATLPTYSKDFTPNWPNEKEWFTKLVASDTAYDGHGEYADFCSLLRTVIGTDADIWVDDATPKPDHINLYTFKVLYNGTTRNAVFKNISADVDYDLVLVIEPNYPKEQTNYDGPMFIHYNNV